ncbi:MAG: hypothetical protein O3A29_18695 [Planctomycetota bacterium]|nr:hypothetical protein [Planctomycetota bacterium]
MSRSSTFPERERTGKPICGSFRGIAADDRQYRLSNNVLFVWAGVHTARDIDLRNQIDQQLAKHFLEMHAITGHE